MINSLLTPLIKFPSVEKKKKKKEAAGMKITCKSQAQGVYINECVLSIFVFIQCYRLPLPCKSDVLCGCG